LNKRKQTVARILLKTTIPTTEDDWSIARFSMLRDLLGENHQVEARDRRTDERGDDVDLAGGSDLPFDQIWLFAVDVTNALTAADIAGIEAFRRRGGGLLLTRDHFDLGSGLSKLSGIGAAHHFHNVNPETEPERRTRDDPFTLQIDWPNYHSGANGDYQEIEAITPAHPLLRRADGGAIRYLPAHPHEGAVSAPTELGSAARVVARGTSSVTGRPFNLMVAIDRYRHDGADLGRAVAEATFHRFADYNWNTAAGCPSFVNEPPGNGLQREPRALNDTRDYARNIAEWLSRS
jgi:hypothetical protein